MSRTLLALTILLTSTPLTATIATADQTGMASMHAHRRVGGKTCFVDHFHYGSSSGEKSKTAAQKAAIESWRSFTDFEYGSDWASYQKSIAKKVGCENSGSSWSCSIEALPCR